MKILKIIVLLIAFALLTVVTQIGGLILLVSLLTFPFINRKVSHRILRWTAKVVSFLMLYVIFTLALVPVVAKPFGRVPLPLFERDDLKPANVLTCLLNRHYVRPELREIAFGAAADMNRQFPGTEVNYLDANFPFIDQFPLFPHLSHNDGKKLDIAFQYNDSKTGLITNAVPSFIGYGICEEPVAGEENKPRDCARKGFGHYNFLRELIPQDSKKDFAFNNTRTAALVKAFASKKGIKKIFIEPHLKARLKLTSSKIRFHGCQAVRHDDHLHVQL